MKRSIASLVLLCSALVAPSAAADPALKLEKGDHICIIGNTLAERMQHHGWLETLIQSRFPQQELVFRNLGYSGDEIDPGKRLRSMDFGSPDQWLAGSAPNPQPGKQTNKQHTRENRFELTNTKADVIFAFFGYNESWAGEAGLNDFKAKLDGQLKHMLGQKYNGKGPPRIVLVSPAAFENLRDPNLPKGDDHNARLAAYTAAMSEVAKANGVTFVDLYAPTLEHFSKNKGPFTINGIHLTEAGDKVVAEAIDAALFGAAPARDAAALEKLRAAVLDKNWHWYHRYRTTDGYSSYGDRAFLQFVDRQTNYEVVQREFEVLDLMTSNRDKVCWAAAQGKEMKPDDSNLPPFLEVKTNKPGSLPDGKHVFLSGEDEIKHMTLGKGLKVNLFASEEQFPELINPVQMAWDTKGRLWVAAWPTYPHWKPVAEEMNDKLLILEDTNGDGRADKCITFADKLHNPTGFEFYGGGVLVAMAPDLVFIKDTDGDDKADVRERVVHGLDTADTHHTSNSFVLDPGGALYFQEGTFHHTQTETPWGPARRLANGGVFRFEPRAQKFDIYVSYGFANPHGHAFDAWGQDFVTDGTGAQTYWGTSFSSHLEFPDKHNGVKTVYQQRTRPCPATEILASRHFPDDWQGNLLVPNVIGFQGILRYKFKDDGSGFAADEQEPLLFSDDANFRPADVETAPDGSIYFTDWQNPIIGHMQHNLRDPSRDKIHGRVYRVTYEGRELLKPVKIAGEPVAALLDALKQPEDRVRYRAKIELSGRKTSEVIPAVEKWVATLDKNDPNIEHHLLEGLWVHQYHNVVNTPLLERMLESKDFRARAAATRVLLSWRDRVSNSLELLKKLAADEHPRVRLEAVRAASFYTEPEAYEVLIVAAEFPSDYFLDYVSKESSRAIEPHVNAAKQAGKSLAFTTEAGARYLLRNMSNEQLLAQDRTKPVCIELLFRPGLQDGQRSQGLQGLAKLESKSEIEVLLDAIRSIDNKQQNRDEGVVFDLVRLLTSRKAEELTAVREQMEKFATNAKQPLIRQIGYVSLMNIDGSIDKAWALATQSPGALKDLLAAMPIIGDPGLKAALYPKIEPLLKALPENLGGGANAKGTVGRFVRIELPGSNRILTLAEVEVMSSDRNVGRSGKATQVSTSNGGDASRGIDGNTNPTFNAGGQTHTVESQRDPWWEVDLGEDLPLDAIRIFNRADGLSKRLDGFTVKVLDGSRNEVFKKEAIPAPDSSVTLELEGGGPATGVRHAVMTALTTVRGKETDTFKTLAEFANQDGDRAAAICAMQRLPQSAWPKEMASPLLDQTIGFLKKLPPADRTSETALGAIEFGNALAALLPADQAKLKRKELNELGIRVVRVGTVFERMSYDKDVLVIEAGKPVEFVFENTDLMPHNFVITQPGAMAEVGQLAESTAQQPGAAERQYVPQSNKILLSSKLLTPRTSQKLPFNAPKQPGVYPYVCTYPGHWRRMYGALYVVGDMEEYFANPEAYLASASMPIADELLKDRRPRTEWKLEELAAAVEEHCCHGRSFATGKQMFTMASCVGCHKLEGVGQVFGPELTKLDPKWKPIDVLSHLLNPSLKVDDKFKTNTFETGDGAVVTGMVVEENADVIKVIENPLTKAEPIVLKRGDIVGRNRQDVSPMPKGLLDKLTRDEILDLLAYVIAGGDKNNAAFQGGHHEH